MRGEGLRYHGSMSMLAVARLSSSLFPDMSVAVRGYKAFERTLTQAGQPDYDGIRSATPPGEAADTTPALVRRVNVEEVFPWVRWR